MKFMTLYTEVFNEDNSVKACGRDKCKELIKLANTIEPEVDHGNCDTGYMNVDSIHRLYNSIKDNI